MARWRQNNGDRADPWGFFPTDRSREQKCFECEATTTGRHHVVPKALGGTKVIPLCNSCHTKVHGFVVSSDAIKAGLKRARARGVRLGAKTKLNQEIVARIVEKRKVGMTIKSIAKSVGLSVGSVHRALRT